jgi:hypothetical protein
MLQFDALLAARASGAGLLHDDAVDACSFCEVRFGSQRQAAWFSISSSGIGPGLR